MKKFLEKLAANFWAVLIISILFMVICLCLINMISTMWIKVLCWILCLFFLFTFCAAIYAYFTMEHVKPATSYTFSKRGVEVGKPL